jgi:hypothetical protein
MKTRHDYFVFLTLISLLWLPAVFAQGSISLVGPPEVNGFAGETFVVEVWVGDPTPVNDLLGVSFWLEWSEPANVEAGATVAVVGPFFGPGAIGLGVGFDDHSEVGVTSISGGYSGSDLAASCNLVVEQNFGGTVVFELTNITALDALGNSVTLTAANTLPITLVGIEDEPNSAIPQKFTLDQNYPNPFNPATTLKYALKQNANVTLKIYNMLGQEVKTLVKEKQTAGYKEILWDGTNKDGVQVPSGIYLYRLEANPSSGPAQAFMQSKKMILLK